MIDTDKYEGHTPAPWVVKKGERMRVWHQKNEMTSTLICSMQATHCEPQDVDAQLIADAPLLLAEVQRLREENERLRDMVEKAVGYGAYDEEYRSEEE
tara:strand:- start:5328 stop:5621 length:294 start_codon:yes stop_codon:yes gene_type:complete